MAPYITLPLRCRAAARIGNTLPARALLYAIWLLRLPRHAAALCRRFSMPADFAADADALLMPCRRHYAMMPCRYARLALPLPDSHAFIFLLCAFVLLLCACMIVAAAAHFDAAAFAAR